MAAIERLPYAHDGVELEAHVAVPDGATDRRAAALICHAFSGQGPLERAKAERLADELGYVGIALDLYGRGVLATSVPEADALMAPFVADRGLLRRRLLAAVDAARAHRSVDPERVAAIGFCFGGLCALDLARAGADLRGVVAFHGLLTPPTGLDAPAVRAKVLVLHGHDDPMAPPDQVLALERELTARGADWQVHVYGGTRHAFTNPRANDPARGTVYHPDADRRSWASMRAFLAEVLA
jgi:dienelactone hydrolase